MILEVMEPKLRNEALQNEQVARITPLKAWK